MTEFQAFPKIPRLNRSMTISEKLDGTNAAVVIVKLEDVPGVFEHNREHTENAEQHIYFADPSLPNMVAIVGDHAVYAQSRNRFITPGKSTDNYGFAGWVRANAEALVGLLGEGTHYGEWWGQGIARKYGMTRKVFSLFNVDRWEFEPNLSLVPGLDVVPVIFRGQFSTNAADNAIALLKDGGSIAAPGFDNPEGIIVYLHAARQMFKVTVKDDSVSKSEADAARAAA